MVSETNYWRPVRTKLTVSQGGKSYKTPVDEVLHRSSKAFMSYITPLAVFESIKSIHAALWINGDWLTDL
jgi:hypothetical protein